MLEPSSSEEDEDYEPSSGIQNNVKDNNLKPPVANGGPRPVSPSTTDGKAGGKVNIQHTYIWDNKTYYYCYFKVDRTGASSPSPSLGSEKGLTGKELEVSFD